MAELKRLCRILCLTWLSAFVAAQGPCSDEQYLCMDGSTCIYNWELCDGIPQCPDEDDEDCGTCSGDQYQCMDGVTCIYSGEVCDGTPQCPGGDDENNCGSDPCMHNPCYNGGSCVPTPNVGPGYECHCQDGTVSTYCNDPGSDPCMYYPCGSNGSCVPTPNIGPGYECHCQDGTTSTYCNSYDPGSDPCMHNPCYNGGSCFPTPNVGPGYECHCQDGTVGTYCNDPGSNPCTMYNPCHQGGSCVPNPSSGQGFECHCLPGTSGTYCDDYDPNFDLCSMGPCHNGGSCISDSAHPWSFKCACMSSYYGKTCDEKIEPGMLKIITENCDFPVMVEGQSKTVKEWCLQSTSDVSTGMPFNVRVVGLDTADTTTNTFKLEIVMKYKDEETVSEPRDIFPTPGSDDVTAQVETMMFNAPLPTKDVSGRTITSNDDAFLRMRIIKTSTNGQKENFETDQHTVMVVTDFSGVDFAVSNNGVMASGSAISNDGSHTIGDVFFNPEFQVTGPEGLPMLANDGAYHIVVFLTDMPVQSPDLCIEDEVPDITVSDKIVGHAKFKSIADLGNVVMELKAVPIKAEKRCGMQSLVMLIESMHTAYGEIKRCNNYDVIQITLEGSGCDATMPAEPICKVFINPFENGRETAFTVQRSQWVDSTSASYSPEDASIFKYRSGTWSQEMRNEHEKSSHLMYLVNKLGNGRLGVLLHGIRNQIRQDESICQILEADAQEKSKEMEELELPPISMTGDSIENLIPEYFSALDKQAQLKDGRMTKEEVKNQASQRLGEIPSRENLENADIKEKIKVWIKEAANKALVNITDAMKESKQEGLKLKARESLCYVGDFMMGLKRLKKSRDMLQQMTGSAMGGSYQDYKIQLDMAQKSLMQNITSSMMLMKQAFSERPFVTCMNETFKRIVKFVVGDLDEDSWLYGQCSTRYSNCLMKVKELCNSYDDNCDAETTFSEDLNFCEMRLMKDMIDREHRVMGNHDIRKLVRESVRAKKQAYYGYNYGENDEENQGEDSCDDEDPMLPKKGPLNLFRQDDDGVIWKGEQRTNGGNICWTQVAVCLCPDCVQAGKKRK